MTLDTFVFSKEEGQNIIVTETFLTNSVTQPDDVRHTIFELKKLREKDLKLQMHIVSLSDYWREGIIPRGLRINKFPSFMTNDSDFKKKWEAILNKCSQDLILLLIQQAKAEKANNMELITAFQTSLQQADTNTGAPFLERISAGLKQLEEETRTIKARKMRRDQHDHEQGNVHQRRRPPGETQHHRRGGPHAPTPREREPTTSTPPTTPQQDPASPTPTSTTPSPPGTGPAPSRGHTK
ncbi:uncharacterized protein LOC106520813, partial [Austrofundulus limnaeus]|uniref:Uncharacterized protein LOC106520813 n=1 Tax=Austrofundulus limnaeus TaxID=52670 RepID=A0A2I4BLC5_AUSLI